ncbi:hypothetical protein ENSA5_22790 [Enhygromyxa salina]|uniref:Uncharacterized protein n=1 Tax=Enhygromyxa salina TaxID=215803 RepID=A0A2S9YBS2_9BACT|nr:hypothetical protein [Enhygromyxa salina]PRQ02461.1 hypothetical protein ENSA5_22790 [Enhygromyxa salina]
MATRVAYFTAGTVGAGHLVRGEAIRRGLARAGFTGEVRSFGPATGFDGWLSGDHLSVEVRDDPMLADPDLAPRSALGRALLDWQPDLVIVDMFWAPVRHLLARLGCPAWLLVRACPPVWLTGAGAVRFDPGAWDRIVAIEPIGAEVLTHAIDPIVIANPNECAGPGRLRELLGAPDDRPLVVVSHAGKPAERGELEARAQARAPAGATVVRLDPDGPGRGLFPAARTLGGADLVVSGVGYNSFWEAHWLGWHERTEFCPFARSIDRQGLRLARFRGHRARANGADTLAQWVLAS